MGKKDKNDRNKKTRNVDALRKEYEAILQEDNKRKERNKYILEKMDKMITWPILGYKKDKVSIQSYSSFVNNDPVLAGVVGNHGTQSYEKFHHKAPEKFAHTTAALILKEIYNKFILIPKRWPNQSKNFEHDGKFSDSNADANSDWKSKYDILNKLKQEEKEDFRNGNTVITTEANREQYDDHINRATQYESDFFKKAVSHTMTSKDNDDNKNISENSFATKYSGATVGLTDGTEKQNNCFDNIHSPDEAEESGKANHSNIKAPEIGEAVPYPYSTIEGSEKIEYLDDDGINPAQISYPSEILNKPLGDVPGNFDAEEYPIEPIDVKDFTHKNNVILKDGVNVNPEGFGLNQTHFKALASNTFLQEDVIPQDSVTVNSEEFNMSQRDNKTATSLQSRVDIPAAVPPTLQSGGDIQAAILPTLQSGFDMSETTISPKIDKEPSKEPENPEITLVSEDPHSDVQVVDNVENLGNPAEGDVFETQEQEGYFQGSTIERAEGDMWNTAQDEEMQDTTPYYEGPHEQVESVQINEYEETSTPYDQNYKQQYENSYPEQDYPGMSERYDYEYKLPQEYDQQQYEQQEYDENNAAMYNQQATYNPETEYQQQNNEQQQYQEENAEHVDQIENQLILEENYVLEEASPPQQIKK